MLGMSLPQSPKSTAALLTCWVAARQTAYRRQHANLAGPGVNTATILNLITARQAAATAVCGQLREQMTTLVGNLAVTASKAPRPRLLPSRTGPRHPGIAYRPRVLPSRAINAGPLMFTPYSAFPSPVTLRRNGSPVVDSPFRALAIARSRR